MHLAATAFSEDLYCTFDVGSVLFWENLQFCGLFSHIPPFLPRLTISQ